MPLRALPLALATLLLPAALLPVTAGAQLIPLKTVPIPSGEQFAFYPSTNFGLAGISIPLDDAQADAFVNPARGALLDGLVVHVLPTFYGETNDAVGGETLPLAATLRHGRQFGTLLFALQEVDGLSPRIVGPAMPATLFGETGINRYVQGSLGVSTPGERTSFGASGMYADLEMMDGASQLYRRAAFLDLDGHMSELRFGVVHDFGLERRLDLVLVRRDLDMTHRQLIGEWVVVDSATWTTDWIQHEEVGYDRTLTHSAQLRYNAPTGAESHFGLVLGGSWKSHPKIPEYDLNFPRDPGTSRAFSIGAGFSERRGSTLFAVEAVFEPAWSHTWAVADSLIITPVDGLIQPGEKTVDNRFRFSNWSLAGAVEHEINRVDLQFGLRVRAIDYELEQQNFQAFTSREVQEGWLEWSPSWGVVFRLDDFDVRYTGRWTSKGNPAGRCGIFGFGGCDDAISAPGDGDIDYVVAPEGTVFLPDYRVTTHRLSISVPIGDSSVERVERVER